MDTASIPIIRQELEHLYSLATQEGLTPFTSLRPMYNYIAYTQSNELLRKIALTMHDFREGTDYIKLDRSTFDYRHDAEIINMASEHFQSEAPPPLDEYFKLLDMYEEYDTVKDIEDEEAFKKAEIIVPVKTVIGLSPRKTSGSVLLTMTQYLYTKNLPLVHAYFVKKLEWVATHGVLSQYLDYNPTTSTLYFHDKQIQINVRGDNTNPHRLLQYLFNHSPFEKHYCDDLNDETVFMESRPSKSYYDACTNIQEKVKDVTDIDDFLDFTSGKGMYMRINPKYSLATVPE